MGRPLLEAKECTSQAQTGAGVVCRVEAANTTNKGQQLKMKMVLPKGADRKRSKCQKALEIMKDTNGKRWKRGGHMHTAVDR